MQPTVACSLAHRSAESTNQLLGQLRIGYHSVDRLRHSSESSSSQACAASAGLGGAPATAGRGGCASVITRTYRKIDQDDEVVVWRKRVRPACSMLPWSGRL
jgi:hypothetical protein